MAVALFAKKDEFNCRNSWKLTPRADSVEVFLRLKFRFYCGISQHSKHEQWRISHVIFLTPILSQFDKAAAILALIKPVRTRHKISAF